MKHDFVSLLDRSGKDALALSNIGSGIGLSPHSPLDGFDPIPMWVADMNFACPPCVVKSISQRIAHPIFGYFSPSDDYFRCIMDWHRTQHGVKIDSRDCIGYHNGLLGGLISAISCVASHGDSILVHSPTYVGFTTSLENAGYRLVHSKLYTDDLGFYRMDYDDMERKIAENRIHVAIFCSPHNPTGRVWEREEILRAMDLFARYDCVVISDEIWSDIILSGNRHVPTQSVSEDARNRTIALYAPSKTFNIAGLVGAYHIVYNDLLRDRVISASSKSHYNDMNVLSMHALIGGYSNEGREWLIDLLEVLQANIEWACAHIDECYPGVTYSPPQGTYMLYLDIGKYCSDHGVFARDIVKRGWDCGVAWQDGGPFNGMHHIRMNLASPLSIIKEAFSRLDQFVFVD